MSEPVTLTLDEIVSKIFENNDTALNAYLAAHGADEYTIRRFKPVYEPSKERPEKIIDRVAIVPNEDFLAVIDLSFDELTEKKYQTIEMTTNINYK